MNSKELIGLINFIDLLEKPNENREIWENDIQKNIDDIDQDTAAYVAMYLLYGLVSRGYISVKVEEFDTEESEEKKSRPREDRKAVEVDITEDELAIYIEDGAITIKIDASDPVKTSIATVLDREKNMLQNN